MTNDEPTLEGCGAARSGNQELQPYRLRPFSLLVRWPPLLVIDASRNVHRGEECLDFAFYCLGKRRRMGTSESGGDAEEEADGGGGGHGECAPKGDAGDGAGDGSAAGVGGDAA